MTGATDELLTLLHDVERYEEGVDLALLVLHSVEQCFAEGTQFELEVVALLTELLGACFKGSVYKFRLNELEGVFEQLQDVFAYVDELVADVGRYGCETVAHVFETWVAGAFETVEHLHE